MVKQKGPLMVHDLSYTHTMSHFGDLLFDTQLNSGFCGLLQLGELVSPDNTEMRDWKKIMM